MSNCANPEIRRWLKKYIIDRGESPGYMIVGLYTLTKGHLGVVAQELGGFDGHAGTRDATVGVDRARAAFRQTVFTTPREQIFAIEYRGIMLDWLSRKTIEKARLERKNCWEIFWGIRAVGPEDEAEDETL